MPADTFNIENYGYATGMTKQTQASWVGSGTTKIYIGPTDYTASVGANTNVLIIPYSSYYVVVRSLGQGSEAVGAGVANVWNGSAWVDGPGTNYYITTVSPIGQTISAFQFYYAPFRTLGTAKSITVNRTSPLDVVGMPGAEDTSTLIFDVEGVTTEIKIDGVMYESVKETRYLNLAYLRNIINGTQYTRNPTVFWWESMYSSAMLLPHAYFVTVKDFNFKSTEKDVSKIDYTTTFVRRALSV